MQGRADVVVEAPRWRRGTSVVKGSDSPPWCELCSWTRSGASQSPTVCLDQARNASSPTNGAATAPMPARRCERPSRGHQRTSSAMIASDQEHADGTGQGGREGECPGQGEVRAPRRGRGRRPQGEEAPDGEDEQDRLGVAHDEHEGGRQQAEDPQGASGHRAVAGLPAHQDVEHGGGGAAPPRWRGAPAPGRPRGPAPRPAHGSGAARPGRSAVPGARGGRSPAGRWSRTSRRPNRGARRARAPPRPAWRDACGPRRSAPAPALRPPRSARRRTAGSPRAGTRGGEPSRGTVPPRPSGQAPGCRSRGAPPPPPLPGPPRSRHGPGAYSVRLIGS